MNTKKPVIIARILNKIRVNTMTGCWDWIGGKSLKGHGVVRIGGRTRRAHRAFYTAMFHDPGPLLVCHRCDNPACVNPDHLFTGTNSDNVRDSVRKGRWMTPKKINRGERNGLAKLTDDTVRRIRSLKGTMSHAAIGRMFGVSETVAGEVLRRETWTHI